MLEINTVRNVEETTTEQVGREELLLRIQSADSSIIRLNFLLEFLPQRSDPVRRSLIHPGDL